VSLRWQLSLLFVLATLLPALPAAWVTRDLLHRSLEISQRAEIDEGLAAGLRRAQAAYRRGQRDLRADAVAWLDAGAAPSAWPDSTTRVERVQGNHRQEIRAGAAELADVEPQRGSSEVPDRHRVQVAGSGSEVWVFQRPVDPQWRHDARAAAEGLQLVRGFKAEREGIEAAFLRPFLTIYALGFLLAMGLAMGIARGITRPAQRLVVATERVSDGDWSARVAVSGPAELRRVGERFNRMVATLDAQHRQLVELETLAGWREMARALAHEVKNPLTPIQLTVEEIGHRYRGDDAEYRDLLQECIRIVVEEVESLREVVGRFREFSRPVELRPEALDLNELVRDVASMQKDLEVQLDLDDGLTAVTADPQRMRQLLMNLASNVRDLRQRGQATTLRLRTRAHPNRTTLVVEDDGPGIAPDERARVFDPYRSGHSSGLGLGLALVKGIVLAHEGEIRVEEAEGGGASFVIELPRSSATLQLQGEEAES
jgi:nitrogen fixation/metabolism regulation signal transduction histidine kinase